MSEPAKSSNAADLHPDNAPDEAEIKALVSTDTPEPGALVPGETSGEIGATDIKIPTLRIVQKTSENPSKLDLGTITVNGDVIVEGEHGAIVTVVSIQKKYEEVLPFGAGVPRRFDHLQDAITDGFKLCRTKADRDSGVPLVEETAIVLLACHRPDGALERSFPFKIAGEHCVPAVWYLRSFAYGNIAKTIFSKLAFDLRGSDLLEARWRITAEKRKNNYGEFYVPQIALLDSTNSKEFAAELRKQMNFTS